MPLLEMLGELSAWAYLLVFAAALAEALPAIGTLVPGQTLVVAAGAAASAGYLDPWGVFAAATLGAAAGDAGAYWIGHTQGRRFLDRHGARFGLTPPRLERSAALLQRNPFLAIVGGRFSAVTRALVPFVAGSLSFRLGLFMAYNAVGAILWAGGSVALGLAVGTGYHAAERVVGGVLLAAVLCAAGLWLAYRMVRWVSPAIRRADAMAFLAAAAGVALFWVAAENVAGGDQLARVDPKAQAFLEARYTPALGSLMQGAAFLASGYVLGPAALLAVGLLWRTRRADAFRVAAAAVLEQGAVRIAGHLMARPHPDLQHAAAAGYSFPSGHAAAATVAAVLLVWLALGRPRWQVQAVLAAGVAFVALSALGSMVLRIHFFTDVVGGVGLGLAAAGGAACAPGMWRGVRQRFLTRPVRPVRPVA